jgi:PKHD-type hydroxylase
VSLYRVVLQQGMLSPSECAALVDAPGPWVPALVTGEGGVTPTTAGAKRAMWKLVPLEPDTLWVFQRLARFLAERATYGFELEEIESPIKVQRYEPGDFHGWHADLGAPRATRRKLGISVQLSLATDYEGGELCFWEPPAHKPAPREQGCAICFPSYMPHQITPVTAGIRHVLTAWVVGPPFR